MIYKIQNEFLSATINSRGAELYSLKSRNDVEYIWQRDPVYWSYCAPILFPIVGNLRDKKTIINNQEYNMNAHGFLRTQEFELLHQGDEEISFVNTFNKETLKLFPFKYKVIITYSLKAKNLRTTYKVINENHDVLLFNIGGHPAINCPLYENEKFNDYTITFEKEESFTSPKVESNGTLNFNEGIRQYESLKSIDLDYELFNIDTIVIPRVRSNYVTLLNKESKGIKFSFPNYKSFAIWSPYGKMAPFVCLEPWIGYGDRHNSDYHFEKKDDIISLKALEEFSVFYDIEVIE
ncbi:MAG: aldose 1-epimerase family protein [Bacilli bacterium]|nr:aldose 1-epimerase family protein [Bacilli bacterium]